MLRRSYAVIWQEGTGPIRAGELVLEPARLRLESGARHERLSAQSLPYASLASVATAKPSERLHGRPTAVIGRPGRDPIAIATVDGVGSLAEIVERLSGELARAAAA